MLCEAFPLRRLDDSTRKRVKALARPTPFKAQQLSAYDTRILLYEYQELVGAKLGTLWLAPCLLRRCRD